MRCKQRSFLHGILLSLQRSREARECTDLALQEFLADSATKGDTVNPAAFVRLADLEDVVGLSGPMRFDGFVSLAVLRKVGFVQRVRRLS